LGRAMSDDVFEKMAIGMTGRFWPLVDGEPAEPDFHGFIRRDDNGYWLVELERPSRLSCLGAAGPSKISSLAGPGYRAAARIRTSAWSTAGSQHAGATRLP
jgi:hypothetical protein